MATTGTTKHSGKLRVYANPEAVAQAAAELFVQVCGQSVRERGRFRVALSGGSTPKRLFQILAEPPLRDQVDWSRVEIFWGD